MYTNNGYGPGYGNAYGQQPMQQPMMQPMQQPMMQPMQQPMMQPMQQPMMQPMQHSTVISQAYTIQMLQTMTAVPNPVQFNMGAGFVDRLQPDSADDNYTVRITGKTMSFGNFGNFTFNNPKPLPTPAQILPPPPQQMSSKNTQHVFKITKDECRAALIRWANLKCGRNKKAAEECHMGEVFSYNALDYKLETFCETRSLGCAYTKTRHGDGLNALGSAPSPDPWSLPCTPNSNFSTHTKLINLPFTDVLQPCFSCNGYGQLRCSRCSGTGQTKCTRCGGDGQVSSRNPQTGQMMNQRCDSCSGRGKITCIRCSGDGKVACNTCGGNQVLKWFLQVHVHYKNHEDPWIKEKTELPDHLIKTVKGEILAQDEGVQVLPIEDSDSPDVIENTRRLIQKSIQAYGGEKRILQRHVLRCVTCAEVQCEFEGQKFKIWVYGEERHVYTQDYPKGCCCTIL